MEKWDVIDQILKYIPEINFNEAKGGVSLFETTIRYLGGLVSGKAQVLRHSAVMGFR
jgi:mannosyl-oligosaccharide alpha-1,2-mannosidase